MLEMKLNTACDGSLACYIPVLPLCLPRLRDPSAMEVLT